MHRVVGRWPQKQKRLFVTHSWHTIASTVMFYDLSLRSFRVRFFSFYFIFIDAVTVVLLRFTLRIIFIEISFYLYFFLCHAPGTITFFFHSFSFIYAFKICFHFTSDKSRGETLWGIRLVERFSRARTRAPERAANIL